MARGANKPEQSDDHADIGEACEDQLHAKPRTFVYVKTRAIAEGTYPLLILTRGVTPRRINSALAACCRRSVRLHSISYLRSSTLSRNEDMSASDQCNEPMAAVNERHQRKGYESTEKYGGRYLMRQLNSPEFFLIHEDS